MPINDGQLDASPRERRLVEERARMKADLKREYIKQWTNPHRMTLDGGYIFDPSLQRWMSMRAQHWHYFKPNPKTLIYPGIVIGTILIYGWCFTYRRGKREEKYRSGQVSYADREFKFK